MSIFDPKAADVHTFIDAIEKATPDQADQAISDGQYLSEGPLIALKKALMKKGLA